MLTTQDKVKFDANNKEHVAIYRDFYESGSWSKGRVASCPFSLEEPYQSIPGMINDKLLRKFLGIK